MHEPGCQDAETRGGRRVSTLGSARCEEAETPAEGDSHRDMYTELSVCGCLHCVALKCSEIAQEKL